MQDETVPPRRGGRALRYFALGLAAVIVAVIVIAVANRNAVALGALRSVVRGFGYDLDVASLDVGLDHAVASGVHVRNLGDEPVLDAQRIAVDYSLRDLLPGGQRLFGLTAVTVVAPHVTAIHHRDGSYNITLPAASAAPATSAGPPLRFSINVTGGSVDLIDRFVRPGGEHRERLSAIRAEGFVAPASGSTYRAAAVLDEGSAQYPIVGTAMFDEPRGFALQHWTAAALPIAGIANFALNSHAVVVEAGEVRDLDVKLGGLLTGSAPMQQHVGVSGRLRGGVVSTPALTQPVRDAHGTFVVNDDSVTLRSLDADLNGIALHVSGALYHFAAPQIALALTARGDLAAAGTLVAHGPKLPVTGALRLDGLAEGPASNPLVVARVSAPHAAYSVYRIDGVRAFAALSGNELDLLDAAARYGPADVRLRGAVALARHTRTTAYATFAAPASGLPYAANLLPGMVLRGVVAVGGQDAKLAVHGYAGGRNGADTFDAPVALAADGSGSVGPVVLERRDGASLYARALIDGHAGQTVAYGQISRLSLLPGPAPALPGLSLPPLPPKLDVTVDAALAGRLDGRMPVWVNGDLDAAGSWGEVHAVAAGTAAGFGARGRLVSSFRRLAALVPAAAGAHGEIDVPFALAGDGRTTIVQVQGARFPNARLRGIELQRADATLGVAPRAIDVYAADLRIGGHDVTAMGRFGDGSRVHLTAGDLDLDPVRAAGIAVAGGSATVLADIGGTYARPTAEAVAALAGARYAGTDISGDAGVGYDGSTLRLNAATVNVGAAYVDASGAVTGLTPGRIAPRYDLRARLADADIATLARAVKNPLRYPAGTLAASVRIGGAGADPLVTGNVSIPEGSLNGLAFGAGRAGFRASTRAVTVSGGRVTVGSTTLAFSGSATRTRETLDLRAPHVDLADFNDYFDEADVLAGNGSVSAHEMAAQRRLDAAAHIVLSGVAYRRFAIGAVNADVRTAGTTVTLRSSVDGGNGRLTANGYVNVPVTEPLRDLPRRAYLDLTTRIAGIDLGNVLPLAGYSVPLVGIVDGSATVRGRYPALALTTQASLVRGVAGRVPIDQFSIAAEAANGHGRITQASLVVPALRAGLTGTFGLRPQDAFDLKVTATSSDINALITNATGKNPGVRGTLSTVTALTGTLAQPHLAAAIDAAQLTYSSVTIPSVHAEIMATRASIAVRNGSVSLPRDGSVTFDGTVPFGSGAATPIAFDFAPHHVDISPYATLLPAGSVLAGIFDGNLGVRGTLHAPALTGSLALTGGAYKSGLLTNGLSDIGLTLDFAGTSAHLTRFHAAAAPGSIDGTGNLAVGDLRDPVRGLRANAAFTIANARITSPKYYVGTVNGDVTAVKAAGAPLTVGGSLVFSDARIPYTALLPGGSASAASAPVLPSVAFNLGVTVGRDVRVQSGPVDIGATGRATLGGTLAKPTLAGQFTSTDGTVSLYRTFNIQYGSAVNFDPSEGVIPSVDATAVTNIPDPPTAVLMHVTGLATHLNLDFSSEPAYSREQILGLLVNAQALGAVSGVASTGSTSGNGVSLTGIGGGFLADQFTQRFLQPFSSKLGSALGLSSLDVNYGTNGAVSATARRRIGKNVSFVYGQQFGGAIQRTSVGINVGTAIAGAQLTFYQTIGSQSITAGLTPFLQSGFLNAQPTNYTLLSIEPPAGSGFVFSYQRKYW